MYNTNWCLGSSWTNQFPASNTAVCSWRATTFDHNAPSNATISPLLQAVQPTFLHHLLNAIQAAYCSISRPSQEAGIITQEQLPTCSLRHRSTKHTTQGACMHARTHTYMHNCWTLKASCSYHKAHRVHKTMHATTPPHNITNKL